MVNKVCVAGMVVLLLSGQAVAGEQLFGRARVVDGDTLAVGGIRVRLEGVAAPEIAHPGLDIEEEPGGAAAAAFMRELVEGRIVVCDLTGDRTHERQVGTCYRDGRDVGAELIKAGLARDCRQHSRGRYAGLERPAAKNLPLPGYCDPRQ